MDYKRYISLDTKVRFGRPCIKGTRITVYDVLNWMSNGKTINDIIYDFPELDELKIRACLAYAANKESRSRTV